MSLSDIIKRAAAEPQSLTGEDFGVLRRALADHPTFILAAAILLRHGDGLLSDDERRELRERVAVYGGDKQAVVAFVDPTGEDFAHFYPPKPRPEQVSTNAAIDTFLETYGCSTPEDEALLERLIFNPMPDYGELLAREEENDLPSAEEAAGNSTDALLNSFILKQKAGQGTPPPLPHQQPTDAPVSAPEPSDDSLLSESLAKIFIKQGRYERAYEIISNLSLNYPKKSIYFADQLRFLQKLIKIQQLKSNKQ